MAQRTSITLPIKDAELIYAVLVDAGTAKLRSLADIGLGSGGVGTIELQLANQLQERIKVVKAKNREGQGQDSYPSDKPQAQVPQVRYPQEAGR